MPAILDHEATRSTSILPDGELVENKRLPEWTRDANDGAFARIRLPSAAEARKFHAARREQRAGASQPQSPLIGTGGAYLVQEDFSARLEIALFDVSKLRSVSEVIRTDNGGPYAYPTVDDHTVEASILANNAATTTSDVSFGQIVLKDYLFDSGAVLIPNGLAEDAPLLIARLGDIIGGRIARGENRYATTGKSASGAGGSGPNGVVPAALDVQAQSSTAISADDIQSLQDALEIGYRDNATFMAHPDVYKAIKILKDASGRNLFQQFAPGVRMLDGYPLLFNPHMSNTIASGKNTLLYGDFSRFKFRDVGYVRLQVLRERYAEYNQTAFRCFHRMDSALADAGTHPIVALLH